MKPTIVFLARRAVAEILVVIVDNEQQIAFCKLKQNTTLNPISWQGGKSLSISALIGKPSFAFIKQGSCYSLKSLKSPGI